MAWYDVYNYENASDIYLSKTREEREKETQKELISLGIGVPEVDIEPIETKDARVEFNNNPQSVKNTYLYNKAMVFKGIKEPDFSQIKKVKTIKPNARFGSQLAQIGASPLARPIKVYKFKTIDTDTGAEIITAQQEIEVYGENEHNYFYMTSDGIKTLNKNEVSTSRMSPEDLELKFMKDMNLQAQKMAKQSMLTHELRPAEPEEKGFFEKVGDFFSEAEQTVKAGVTGFGSVFTSPFNKLIDLAVKRQGKYAHDPEYFKTIKLKYDEKGDILPEYEKNLEKLDNLSKYEIHDFPKGYSRETDAMAQNKSKAEIAQAREEDRKAIIKEVLGRDQSDELKSREEAAVVAGEILGIISEFLATRGAASILTAGTKVKTAKKILDVAITGGGVGFLHSLKKRDADAKEYLRNMAKETVFLGVGGAAARGVGKALGPTEKALTGIGKSALTGTSFGLGGTAASYPFMTEEEKQPGNLAFSIGAGAGFDIAGATAGRTFRKASKAFTRGQKSKPTKPVKKVDTEYKLDTPLKQIPKKDRPKAANKVTRDLLTDIGTNIEKKVGSLKPKDIMTYYNKKYSLGKNITLDKTLRGSDEFARVEIGPKGDIELRINTSKPDKEIAASIRHEIEHILDRRTGYFMKETKVKGAKTLGDYMSKPGHFSKYKNFEAEYLENALKDSKLPKDLRQRMPLETIPEGSNLANENLHRVNKDISPATNLPVYVKPQETKKEKVKNLMEKGYTNFINRQQAVDKLGKNVKMSSQNYSTHHGTSDHIILDGLVNRGGDKIGKSVKDVLKAPKGFQPEYDSYLLHKHHIDRMVSNKKGVKNPGKPVIFKGDEALSVSEAKQIVKDYERRYPEFKKHAEDYYKTMDDFVREWAVDGGLLTKNEYKAMKALYPNFVPTMRELEEAVAQEAKGVSVKAFGKAKGGKQTLKSLSESVPGYIQKIVRAQRRNSVHQEILNAVLENPRGMQKYAQIYSINPKTRYKGKGKSKKAEVIKTKKEILDFYKKFKPEDTQDINKMTDRFDEMLMTDKTKGNFMVVLDQGQPITLKINDKNLWKGLMKMQQTPNSSTDAFLNLFNKHITTKFKGGHTVYNPFFAVGNIARDIPTAYIQGSVDNPITYTKNLFGSLKSMMKKDDMWQKFQGLGISTSNITKAERHLKDRNKKQKFMDTILSVLNWAGDVSETMPRLAEFKATYKRGLKKGLPEEQVIKEAMYNAKEVTVNFARGGDITKKADALMPYINAGTQGFDKWVRTLITDGVAKGNFKPLFKAMGVTMVPTVALDFINRNVNKDIYMDIPDYVKDNYYLIPTPTKKYIRLPKTKENGLLFSTILERLSRHFIDSDPSAFEGIDTPKDITKRLGKTVINPFQAIAEGGIIGPATNIYQGGNLDYFGRPIEPLGKQMSGVSKKYITREDTSKMSKALAPALEQLGLSPAQSDYLIKNYAGIIGDVVLSANDKDETLGQKLIKMTRLTHDTEFSSKAKSDWYKSKDQAKRDLADFEEEKGIKKLRKDLKDKGVKSTKSINNIIRRKIGSDYKMYLELKNKLKEVEKNEP